MTETTSPCGWLIEVANGCPEPDFPEDCYDIVECGDVVPVDDHGEPNGRYALCPRHQAAMDLSDEEFERTSDLHDGRAFS